MYQTKSIPSSTLVHSCCSLVHGQHLECGASKMEPINGGNSLNNPSLASKQRLRWTHELHERFVDAVAQLGGPDREFSSHLSDFFLNKNFQMLFFDIINTIHIISKFQKELMTHTMSPCNEIHTPLATGQFGCFLTTSSCYNGW